MCHIQVIACINQEKKNERSKSKREYLRYLHTEDGGVECRLSPWGRRELIALFTSMSFFHRRKVETEGEIRNEDLANFADQLLALHNM